MLSWILCSVILSNPIDIQIKTIQPQLHEDKGLYLAMPNSLALNPEHLFISDQTEHTILRLDHQLQQLDSIGVHGQGPGELVLPVAIEYTENALLIYDDTRTFHFFDLEGTYQHRFKVLQTIFDFTVVGEHIVASAISRKTGGHLYVYSHQGDVLYSTPVDMNSQYENFFQDNRVRMMADRSKVHLLQMYAPKIWHFDPRSRALETTELKFNPLEDPTYQETKFQYCFTAFVVLEDAFLCFYPSRGGVTWCRFAKDGTLLQRSFIPIIEGEANSVAHAELMSVDGTHHLFLLITQPHKHIARVEISLGK